MGAGIQIRFLIDEHLPIDQMRSPLEGRGHQVKPAGRASEDQSILAAAEETGAIIVTADKWFLQELFRFPAGHPRCYKQAGVIRVPRSWSRAQPRIKDYLPIIEAIYVLRAGKSDRRVAIDLSRREIRIREP